MELQQQRAQLAEYGRKLIWAGLTVGTGGNLSVRVGDTIAVTPSGIAYEDMRDEDIVLLDENGEVKSGRYKPSSEAPMHCMFYRARTDRNAVVHTHSPAMTAFSCLRRPLPAISYLTALAGRAEIPCAPYVTFGTEELGRAAVEAAGGCDAVILANHGLVCLGQTLQQAFDLAQQLEFCADIYMRCLASGQAPVLLTQQETEEAQRRFGTYGQ